VVVVFPRIVNGLILIDYESSLSRKILKKIEFGYHFEDLKRDDLCCSFDEGLINSDKRAVYSISVLPLGYDEL